MSKIEEMADKAFPNSIIEYSDLCRRTGYIKCANAVLSEIEFLFHHCREYQLYHLLEIKIQELKGE